VIMVDSGAATNTYLQVTSLVELQRESISVGVNSFPVKRKCYIFGLLQKCLHHV
jgi:hypothetical protein